MSRSCVLATKLLLFCVISLKGQQWQWAMHAGLPGTASGSSIGGVDSEGNCYLATMLTGEDNVSPWEGYRLLKVDATGSTIWNNDVNRFFQGRIATDRNGNCYMAYSDRLICFDKDGNEIWQVNSNGMRSFGKIYLCQEYLAVDGADHFSDSTKEFVARYKFNGVPMNTVYYSIPQFAKCTLDKNENLIMLTDSLPDAVTQNTQRLIVRDKAGHFMYNRESGAQTSFVTTDDAGNIYINGSFGYRPVTFNNTSYRVPQGELNHYQFLLKYSPNGELLWYKIIEGALGAGRVTCDNMGTLYYVVDFSAHIKIGGFEINHPTGGLLIIKYDPNGNMVWNQFTPSYNTGPFGYLQPESIYAAQNGDLYLSGRITGTLKFGNTIVESSSNMYSELFVGKIIQPKTMGTQGKTRNFLWNIFPNPSIDRFFLTGGDDENLNISVTDINGRVLKKTSINAANGIIDLTGFAPGVYLVRLQSGERIEVKKLVKN